MLVDIENVVGGAVLHENAARWARVQICGALDIKAPDQVVIGISHIGLLSVGSAWPNLRYLVRSGADGADRALLAVLDEDVATRFDELVLVSGDGIFAAKIAALTARGVRVTVVAHPGGVAKRLRLAAHRTLYLEDRYTNSTLGGAA
ncbi:NYN domain-containing protein [Gordonia rubripertincta]|uniref:NYN domain-containing protein n=1 Tax=Gordonia rubripertincta TaxID=36822 RepID=A0ABT4N5Q3_GORRU|nr:NYN domain-containing protein [Gordonia rubripertincta]MCZ4553696.1 NYN domain-containing protein [Gordonia rubripertincta]